MEWMILPLKRYAQFSGRSRRKEYWMWVLFTVIMTLLLSLLDSVLGLGGSTTAGQTTLDGASGVSGVSYGAGVRGGVLANIFSLATLIPTIAVSVRRLHDLDRSGWWLLMPVLPYAIGAGLIFGSVMTTNTLLVILGGIIVLGGLVCAIVLLVWFCTGGTDGPNNFGDDPKTDSAADLARTFE